MQLAIGNILATIHMPAGIKALLLIRYLRRNLVSLLHWPYAAQSIYIYTYNMNRRYAHHIY